jgi:hypothetical protein
LKVAGEYLKALIDALASAGFELVSIHPDERSPENFSLGIKIIRE